MRAIVFVILAAAFWVFLGSTLQWAAALPGVLMAGALFWYLRRGPDGGVFRGSWTGWRNPFAAAAGIARYGWALAVANVRVGWLIVDFRRPVRSAILKVYCGEMGDLERTIVANSITLTPGTITVDFSDDGRHLYVHVLEAEVVEAARQELLAHLETHFGKGLQWWKLS